MTQVTSDNPCSNYRRKLQLRKIDIMSAEPGPEASTVGSSVARVGEGFHLVSSLSELKKSGRKRVAVGDRVVVVFHVAGQLYALDYFCYRERKLSSSMSICYKHRHTSCSVIHGIGMGVASKSHDRLASIRFPLK